MAPCAGAPVARVQNVGHVARPGEPGPGLLPVPQAEVRLRVQQQDARVEPLGVGDNLVRQVFLRQQQLVDVAGLVALRQRSCRPAQREVELPEVVVARGQRHVRGVAAVDDMQRQRLLAELQQPLHQRGAAGGFAQRVVPRHRRVLEIPRATRRVCRGVRRVWVQLRGRVDAWRGWPAVHHPPRDLDLAVRAGKQPARGRVLRHRGADRSKLHHSEPRRYMWPVQLQA